MGNLLQCNFLEKYINPVFIETGTWEGDGIRAALKAGFTKIISIEYDSKIYNRTANLFKNDPRVTLILGDSSEKLIDVVQNLQTNATFWLDAHFHMKHGKKDELCPLYQEIKNIRRNDTVLIDDRRLWKSWKVDEIRIKNILKSVNPNYNFTYENGTIEKDIFVAFPMQ